MAKNSLKVNFVDLAALLILVALAALVFFALKNPLVPSGKTTLVKIKVEREADAVYPEAQKLGDVYFNSVNKPVKAVKTEKKADFLEITLSGSGQIENDRYIFNGQRVLIGQKAEIHGIYFAQGVITEVKYAD